jgi:hypothetical protein
MSQEAATCVEADPDPGGLGGFAGGVGGVGDPDFLLPKDLKKPEMPLLEVCAGCAVP